MARADDWMLPGVSQNLYTVLAETSFRTAGPDKEWGLPLKKFVLSLLSPLWCPCHQVDVSKGSDQLAKPSSNPLSRADQPRRLAWCCEWRSSVDGSE